MKKKYLIIGFLGASFQFTFPSPQSWAQVKKSEIAFLADIHLQDVYAELNSADFKGVFNPKSGKNATIRTMKSQLNSTRLFNENYFALIAALEDLKKRDIHLVVLPGDFTDDGQPMNVLALKKILDHYALKAGMRFFLTTGNHDPVKPFGGIAGKRDFMNMDGSEKAIAGNKDLYPNTKTAVSDQINYWGYEEITQALSGFGFFPSEKDLFWTHPFQELEVDDYSYRSAKTSASLKNRVYQLNGSEYYLPDASYVVEPTEGIWLLAIDANVYTQSEGNWRGSSIGFNQAIDHKKHQLEWIKKVSIEAEKRGKTLISFSHYPLVDFHEHASEEMKQLFGGQKLQLQRVPSNTTSQYYAAAGIKIHFAGHMHINDTGIFHDPNTNQTLYNIQVPSLAAFPPAYKIATTEKPSVFEIETVPLYQVENMNEFFDLYEMEHRWLQENQDPEIWDIDILASKDYLEYTRNHLLGLTKSRFIPSDWPKNLALMLQILNQEQLLTWSKLDEKEGEEFLQEILKLSKGNQDQVDRNFIDDFYLIKNGDEIGKSLIPSERIAFYERLFSQNHQKVTTTFYPLSHELHQFFAIFNKLFHSKPSGHFRIDLKQNRIEPIR